MKWLENLTGGYSSSAKVVNDTLVLSLPDAKSPVVWRMELTATKAAAFELQQEDDDFILVMKTPKGETRKIAPFDNRAKALRALMSTSQAMEHAEFLSDSRVSDDAKPAAIVSQGGRRGSQALAGLLGIVILGGLLFVLSQIGPNTRQYAAPGDMSASASTAGSPASTGEAPGVPVSADDFLMQR